MLLAAREVSANGASRHEEQSQQTDFSDTSGTASVSCLLRAGS